ncbi:hypothetical protein PG996_005657 [Apiospora saccharicola]|uniref:F-box domain-containing protein n=1 Tax=Apiospora saccharicola TaxID=335842 RepID=A0ABR1VM22_9PEZI
MVSVMAYYIYSIYKSLLPQATSMTIFGHSTSEIFLVPATSAGLSDLPVELIAHILGYLDSYEDLATCISSSAVLLDGYLYKSNTTLAKVVCRSIGDECLADALTIVHYYGFSDSIDRDELRSRTSDYLTNRASQDLRPSSRQEVVQLCQLDRVIMRFVDNLVRRAKADDWTEEEGLLPHWADSSFSHCCAAIPELRPAINRAELVRYKRAFLRHELFHKLFTCNPTPGLFNNSQKSKLLLGDLEMWEVVGILAIHTYLRDLHMVMFQSLYDEIQTILVGKAAQHSIQGFLDSDQDKVSNPP